MNFDEISKEHLEELDLSELSDLIKNEEYMGYFLSEPSKEHYRLLSYLSLSENNINFLDVGTLKGCSALAMSINPNNKVYSFDISNSFDLFDVPKNVTFFIDNILQEKYKELILTSKYILLDTFHDGTFEVEFMNHLNSINYNGILLLDDIFLNDEMKLFWDNITLPKKNITFLGHSTGTGVVFI